MNIKFCFLISMSLALILTINCANNPTAPDHTNPLDIDNPKTYGNPFQLQGTFSSGGVSLSWQKVELPSLAGYVIYRDENNGTRLSKLASVTTGTTAFLDATVQKGHSYWYKVTAFSNTNTESSQENTNAVRIDTPPVIVINNGASYTTSRQVILGILALDAQQMWLSSSPSFGDGCWETFKATKSWSLAEGDGLKIVYLKVKYSNDNISQAAADSIILDTTSPQAKFTVTPESGIVSTTTVQFDATASSDNITANSNLLVRWDWENDGTWDTGYTVNKIASHQYNQTGVITTKLEVKDEAGLMATATRQITVNGDNTPPIAFFTVTPSRGTIDTDFYFDASGSYDAQDPVSELQVRWDWENDGIWDTAYSNNKTASHRFLITGIITIKLEVKDSGGATNETTRQITIENKGKIAGQVTDALNGAPISGAMITTQPATTTTTTDNWGSYSIENLDPGTYTVLASKSGYNSNHTVVTVTGGGIATANIQLSAVDGLVAYYPFNGNANDKSANGNHGIVYGATLTDDRFGNANCAYYFDGIDDYILVPNSASLNLRDALTISAWVKFPTIPANGAHILMKSQRPDTYEYGLNLNTQNSGAISASIGGYNVVNVVSNSVTINTWYHVVATWQYPGISEIYLNGERNKSIATIGNIDPLNCRLTIGRIRPDESRSSYNGIVDDVRIYNRVLSSPEIQALYHEGGW